MSYTILDAQLREQVLKILHGSRSVDVEKLHSLLKKGADPKAEIIPDEFSAYNLVHQYNDKGQFNGLIEIFDEHIENLTRPADSDWEGMHI